MALLPDVIVEEDRTTDPLVIPTAWTDQSSRFRSGQVRYGRQRQLNKTQPGYASVKMNNQDRGLDPSPTIHPTNHFRLRAVWSGTTYDLFRGFVKSRRQEWPARKDAISRVEAEDGFSLMARYDLEGQSIAEMSTGDHLAAVLTLYGWPPAGSVPPGKTWWRLGTAGFSELGTTTYLGESLESLDEGTSTIMATTLTGNLLDHLLNVAELTEGGLLYMGPSGDVIFKEPALPHQPSVAVWGDAEGEFPYHDIVMSDEDEAIYNDVRITRRGDSAISTAKDQTSIDTHGPRTLPISDTLFSTKAQADQHAATLLDRYKDPWNYPVRLVLRPSRDPNMWPLVLGMQLGTKITVRRRPPGGGDPIEVDSLIVGITYEIDPNGWQVTWDLEPTRVHEGYWYLGVAGMSELGTTTKLG